MKHLYLKSSSYILFATLLAIGNLNAQQTLTSANNMTLLGESQTYYVADSNAVNYSGTVGANVTWDYSNLMIYGNTVDEDIVDPSTTPEGSNFAGSAIADDLEGSLIIYRNNEADSLSSQGYVLTIPGMGDAVVTLTDEVTLMRYPFTFGDSYTDMLDGDANIAISPFPIPYSGVMAVEADGYGTLMLGTASYTNVLRVKVLEASQADASGLGGSIIPINREQYFYYDPANLKFPILMHVTLEINGTSSSVMYSKDALPVFVSTNDDLQLNTVSVFPNPAQDKVNVSIEARKSENGSVKIMNALGKIVLSGNIAIKAGSNQVSFDISALTSGIYFVTVKQGNYSVSKKLMVR